MTEKIYCKQIDESCYKYVHSSGVTVYMHPMKGFSGVSAQFAAKFGAEDNNYRLTGESDVVHVPDGTAHYLEHKLFESEECDAFELFAQTGASCNAGTSYDHTVYYFNCSDHFEKNLEILLNFVQHPYFTPENVEKERGIISQEITMYEDNPSWQVLMSLLMGVYVNNPIRNDIAGTVESISEIDDKLLYKLYDIFYNPANMYLCIAGNFDVDKAVEICDRCLESRQPVSYESIRAEEPVQVGEKRLERFMPVAKPLFGIGFKRPDHTGEKAFEEYIYYNILFDILFGDMSEFYTRLRDRGILNNSFRVTVFMGRGYVMPNAVGESDDPDLVLEEMKKELCRAKKEPPTKEEFDLVKKATYGSSVRNYTNGEGTASVMLEAVLQELSPFAMIEMVANAEYSVMLDKLAELDVENCCLSVVRNK